MKHRNNTKQRRRISVLVVPVMIFMCVCVKTPGQNSQNRGWK